MFIAVWMLYAADRLLDARSGSSRGPLEARHHFHHRHRYAFSAGLLVGVPALLFCELGCLRTELYLYLLLVGLLAAWMALVHLRSGSAERLPKELAVGAFFAAAVCIPAVARVHAPQFSILAAALPLALLCSLNGIFIYAWEHRCACHHAHVSTRWALRRLPEATAAAMLFAVSFAACAGEPSSALHRWTSPASACAVSAACLFLLHRSRVRLRPVTLRAAADLCLLTPLIPLVALRCSR